uniref:Uncharacterized protein n=2 Tax=Physcomitrium patens TaxID=3218 RepID=A0A7I4CCW5_PHYPA
MSIGNIHLIFLSTTIVRQEEMKMCLTLNAIEVIMIVGYCGIGKSTTLCALVVLLPKIEVVARDPLKNNRIKVFYQICSKESLLIHIYHKFNDSLLVCKFIVMKFSYQ